MRSDRGGITFRLSKSERLPPKKPAERRANALAFASVRHHVGTRETYRCFLGNGAPIGSRRTYKYTLRRKFCRTRALAKAILPQLDLLLRSWSNHIHGNFLNFGASAEVFDFNRQDVVAHEFGR
jgi:hypothetical protein